MMFRHETDYYTVWELHMMMIFEIICSNYSALIGLIGVMLIGDIFSLLLNNKKTQLIMLICYVDILLMCSNQTFNDFWFVIYKSYQPITCFTLLILHNIVLFPIYYAKNYLLINWFKFLV